MNPLSHRALARDFKTLVLAPLLLAVMAGAAAEEPDPAALELDEAARLAVQGQPLLEAQRQAVRGARAAAIAAGQLPDPVLVGGLTDLTVTGPDRYTLRNESDTQFMLGLKQMFPGGDERALRGARGTAEAERLAAELHEQQRMVRREAGLAWLAAWKATQAQTLITASLREAERQVQAVDIAYRSGRATQAELLASRVSVELLNDGLAGLQQQERHARNQLRRWIGADAERAICPDLPAWPAPDAAALLARLERHPHVAAQAGAVMVARADVDLARAEYAPDWSLQAGYGYRPEFADYASLQFEIGLPFFTGQRQDRATESRVAELGRAESLKEDWLRQHRADIALNVDDWQRLQQRFRRYDETILPQAQQRLEAALAGYGAGGGTLTAVLDARRSLLEIRMQRLELQFDAAQHQVQLQYFVAPGEPS
jgi:outer membrane protein, heavy metal efflux system